LGSKEATEFTMKLPLLISLLVMVCSSAISQDRKLFEKYHAEELTNSIRESIRTNMVYPPNGYTNYAKEDAAYLSELDSQLLGAIKDREYYRLVYETGKRDVADAVRLIENSLVPRREGISNMNRELEEQHKRFLESDKDLKSLKLQKMKFLADINRASKSAIPRTNKIEGLKQ